MPALIGLENSLDLILTGRHIDGKRAFKKGIADRLVPKELLEEKALQWAEKLGKTRLKKQSKTPGLRERILRTVPGGKKIIFDQAQLAEGGQLDDPAAYVHRLNKLLLELSK